MTASTRIRSFARQFAYLAASTLAACGSDSTAPLQAGTDAAKAAQTFAQLADSVARTGGDADLGAAYGGIAATLRIGGRLTPIVLSIDGTPATFLAAATSYTTTINTCPAGAQCFAPPEVAHLRHLIAFDEQNPKRIVQLSSSTNDEKIGAVLDPSALAIYVRMATLVYMDGAGGTFIGTSGTQSFAVSPTKTACPTASGGDTLFRWLKVGTCVLADVEVQFSGKVEPAPFKLIANSATGTHAIAMSAQTVPGTHHQITIDATQPQPVPPVKVQPSNQLPSALQAKVSGDAVTLAFTVKNPTADAVKVVYPTGQKYDFVAIDSATGAKAWRWSANKGFTQAIVEETVPAGGSLTFTEVWKPVPKGLYLVHALLTSTSHRSEAYASVLVP